MRIGPISIPEIPYITTGDTNYHKTFCDLSNPLPRSPLALLELVKRIVVLVSGILIYPLLLICGIPKTLFGSKAQEVAIEKALSSPQLFIPKDWKNVLEESSKQKQPMFKEGLVGKIAWKRHLLEQMDKFFNNLKTKVENIKQGIVLFRVSVSSSSLTSEKQSISFLRRGFARNFDFHYSFSRRSTLSGSPQAVLPMLASKLKEQPDNVSDYTLGVEGCYITQEKPYVISILRQTKDISKPQPQEHRANDLHELKEKLTQIFNSEKDRDLEGSIDRAIKDITDMTEA